jgi:hypothetical protein
MRKLIVLLVLLVATSRSAQADVGVGIFVGEPLGFDVKLGLGNRSGLDLLIGASSFREGRVSYAHVTYLLTPAVGHGNDITIPLRLGIGGAIFGVTEDAVGLAVRVPFEVGIRFRRTPLEIYGEIALALDFLTDNRADNLFLDLQGGVGVRFYF